MGGVGPSFGGAKQVSSLREFVSLRFIYPVVFVTLKCSVFSHSKNRCRALSTYSPPPHERLAPATSRPVSKIFRPARFSCRALLVPLPSHFAAHHLHSLSSFATAATATGWRLADFHHDDNSTTGTPAPNGQRFGVCDG